MTADGAIFARRLYGSRQLAGLSQQDLAERSGLSVRAISNLERGRAVWPHPGTVDRLAEALGLTAEGRAEFTSSAGRRLSCRSADPPDVPRQLPGPVRRFTGRGGEIAGLTGLLPPADANPAPSALIVAICGMPGVGKTALAVRWAHQVADRFPDGQLYVDLRGYGPCAPPLPAGDALARFLRSLGVADPDIPGREDERAAAYRTLLARRRILVVLDNARDAEQLSPLLPGSADCMTLVTSRDALSGLVACQGAVRLELDPLPPHDAVDLLRGLICQRAIDHGAEEDLNAMAELAGHCGRLPFALRVAAQVAELRGVAVAELAAQMADPRRRLDILAAGGDRFSTVRALFAWSYRDLSVAAAEMFRLISVHPGPDVSAGTAASLAGLADSQACQVLTELTRAHLLSEHPPGRFSCHNLLRIYGAEQAADRRR